MTAFAGERSLGVLTAIVNPSLEAALVAGFTRHELGVTVVRRCVDLIELRSAGAGGTAQAALISADLRGLDRESFAELARAGLVTVGLADTEAEEAMLHPVGADLVVPAVAQPERWRERFLPRRRRGARPVDTGADPSAGAGRLPADAPPQPTGAGTVVAVWGAAGASGRATVAIGLADALAGRGISTLLIDADPFGGTVAILTDSSTSRPGSLPPAGGQCGRA